MGGAFEQARVDVENVAGKGLASGWSAEQEGKLAIGAGVLRKVVVNDQHVATRYHKMLRDAGRGVRRDVGETRRVIAFGDNDDGVIHRTFFAEARHDLGDRGSAPADRTIDTEHIFPALVQDGINRDGGLACLAIAQNQLALAAPDRNERIDDLQAGLERHGDRRAVHDGRSGAFCGQALASGYRPAAIEWPTERVDDASQQSIAHSHVHDPSGAFDFVTRVQILILAEQHDTDFVLVHVERDAEYAAGKLEKFLKPDTGEARDSGDTGGNVCDRAHLVGRQLRREGSPDLAYSSERAVEDTLQGFGWRAHELVGAVLGSSGLAWGLDCSFKRSPTPFSSDER